MKAGKSTLALSGISLSSEESAGYISTILIEPLRAAVRITPPHVEQT